MKVSVLAVFHRHGTDTTVHADDAAARHSLAGYARDWWTEAVYRSEHRGGTLPEQAPEDDEEAIKLYFELMEDESAEVTETELALPPLYGVLVADTNIIVPSEDNEAGSGDDAEVRGPFLTQEEASTYAMTIDGYMVLVVPLLGLDHVVAP